MFVKNMDGSLFEKKYMFDSNTCTICEITNSDLLAGMKLSSVFSNS